MTSQTLQVPAHNNLIAIIGVDGSGKSTVIQRLLSELPGTLKGLHSFHILFKPGLKGQILWNHALPPRGALVSGGKLLYKALQWSLTYRRSYAPLFRKNTSCCATAFTLTMF